MLSREELEVKREELERKRLLRREARRKKVIFYLLCTLIGLALLAATAYWSYTTRYGDFPVASTRDDDTVTVLLMGVDSAEGGSRTDTMILFSLDKRSGAVGAVAIPRDTRVQIPGRRGFDRINAAHAIGGPELAVRSVEALTGVSIDYYVRVDYTGFQKIIDGLGGVVINVEKPMYYVDQAQDLIINLQPGIQLLNGEQALHYVRYRADRLGDVSLVDPEAGEYGGRVVRQLEFLRAVFKQALSVRGILNAPGLIAQFRQAVVTDIPLDEAISLLMRVQEVPSHEIQMAILPGAGEVVNGASYWVVDTPKARETLNKLIVHRAGMVRVEVLNGNGMAGVASMVADMLREKGFEVVAVGNADHFSYARTSIIPHTDDVTPADEVARALGRSFDATERTERTGRPAVAADADVTVILGRDFHI